MRARLLLLGAILSEVAGTVCLRGALDHPVLYVVVVAGYLASFWFLAGSLKLGMPLGVSYALWGAIGVAITAVASALLFAERLSALSVAGLALIVVGVFVVELGSDH